jgi:cob(I)alamin adenosyltransferase
MLGLAKNLCRLEVKDLVESLQRDLFVIGTEMATPQEHYHQMVAGGKVVTPEMVQRLEDMIDDFEAKIDIPRNFIVPGGCASSAVLDVARTVVRRAERRAVSFKQTGGFTNEEILKYLNRLADLIFVLARYEEQVTRGDNPGN